MIPFRVIEDFFEVFYNKNATVLRNAFSKTAMIQRASYREWKTVPILQDISNFIYRVASRPDTHVLKEALGITNGEPG